MDNDEFQREEYGGWSGGIGFTNVRRNMRKLAKKAS